MAIITKAELENAAIDAENFAKAANELGAVTPRYGEPYKTLPQLVSEQAIQEELASASAAIAVQAAARADFAFSWSPTANIYDSATMRQIGHFISTGDGSIQADAAWDYVRIPVKPGWEITWNSNTDRPDGSGFLKSDFTPVSGSQDATPVVPTVPQTRTAPAEAAYVGINLKSNVIAAPTQMMVNFGDTSTAYVPYDNMSIKVNDEALPEGLEGIDEVIGYESVSSNLFNPALVQDGYYISIGNGTLQAASGWSVSGFIPIVAGEAYTISASAARDSSISFFSAPTGNDIVSFSHIDSETGTRTVYAPPTATHMVFSVKTPTYPVPTWIMANSGTNALQFEAWSDEKEAIVKNDRIPKITLKQNAKLVLNGYGPTASYVESGKFGKVIRNDFIPFPIVNLIADPCRFNLQDVYLNGTAIRHLGWDDIAPDITEGVMVGGNHGYKLGSCTSASHGKTSADEGSKWSLGGNQFVLVKVISSSNLLIAHMTANGGPSTGTLTHVSGASNASSFTLSSVSEIQWYPPHGVYKIECFIDGEPNPLRVGSWAYDKHIQFVETCDILTRASIISWWVANGGARAGLAPVGTSLYRMVNTYKFDCDGQLTIHRSWTAILDTEITSLWGTQVGYVSNPDIYRVPGSEPFSYDGETVDYGSGVPANRTVTGGTSAIFNNANLQATGEYANRALIEWDDYVFAVGLLPVGAASFDVRRANTSTKAMEINLSNNGSGKIYFRTVDKGIYTLTAGDTIEVVAFRHVLLKETGKPLICPVRLSDNKAYLFIDWLDYDGLDSIAVPADMLGRSISVLPSRNVELNSTLSSGNITPIVDAAGGHAALILELTT